jgi:hypothetical protein
MNILIVGSTSENSKAYIKNYISACRGLGAALASAGHTIILGSSKEYTADRYIAEGAIGTGTATAYSLLVITPYETDLFPPHPRIKQRLSRESWTVARVDQILAADGVITIGGNQSTLEAGFMTIILKRPLLPLRHFGGASEQLLESVEPVYKQFVDIEPKLRALCEGWGDGSASSAVELMVRLINRNPFGLERQIPVSAFPILLLFLLSLWVWFSSPRSPPTR